MHQTGALTLFPERTVSIKCVHVTMYNLSSFFIAFVRHMYRFLIRCCTCVLPFIFSMTKTSRYFLNTPLSKFPMSGSPHVRILILFTLTKMAEQKWYKNGGKKWYYAERSKMSWCAVSLTGFVGYTGCKISVSCSMRIISSGLNLRGGDESRGGEALTKWWDMCMILGRY